MAANAKITAEVKKALTHLDSGNTDKVKAILQKLVKTPKKHVLSGYNVFIGEKLKGKKMTMREACAAWKTMTAEEKAAFTGEGREEAVEADDLTGEGTKEAVVADAPLSQDPI